MTDQQVQSGKSTEGMVDYNENSSAQLLLVRLLRPLVHDLVSSMDEPSDEFKIVDYGCGPGVNSIEMVKPAIEACLEKFDNSPIVVCHSDQVANDWNTLFELVEGPSGYAQISKNIRTEAEIGSFYDRVASPASVSIGTCIFASHWLSQGIQLNSPGTVWFADLQRDARQIVDGIAQKDWTHFLLQRAQELRSGGYLVVGTLGSVPDPSEKNGIAASGRGIYRAIQVVAKTMADDGHINPESLDSFLFSLWFMTEAEAKYALEQNADLRDAFEICQISVKPAPIKADDIFKEYIDDAETYAEKYVGYTRAFADSTLRTQLFGLNCNSAEMLDQLMTEFYSRLAQLYEAETSKYACEVWHLVVVLRRK
ncbi:MULTISPECIES: hypothetical protein [unclassified Ruegeria]|uniref:hypothetical protein n=1 Tax=unclassified Ruegeria TaxID=2625375 RepID=UPI0014884B85|nr:MULTISPECIES: hypothetical protein [unclassified Ruegeria]NOD77578.1 hypothetical protein [Ruegeria sp. HKCCD4332]NOD89783.1 hypothetical protein [Ruegeria sp. HKCCD4318]NOE14771.1 hypothetical protein [Ruegeria sp. HKCCD4318-2]NOG10876.1 hypothetical protein [Ruegeria sp. HKCCD4315]